ncbi:unnamed protein product [Dovyalis caffra]|uniref:Uncharacterized protein n=1 Tax=Dovyalis caffra TaxID=77055 RepID=A0AAV1QL49_9ROSI|nr:unnamed protein product [Dovyalis caffra]
MRSSETVPGLRSGAKLNRTSHTSTANRGSLPAYGPPRLDIFQKTRGGILCRKSFDVSIEQRSTFGNLLRLSARTAKHSLSGPEIARTAESVYPLMCERTRVRFLLVDYAALGIARRLCNGGQTWQASGAPVDFILCNRAVNSRAVVSGLITRLQR